MLENGPTNLIYTFSRTGPTTAALTVNYTIGGSATLGSDYTGIGAGGAIKSVIIAAGSSTALVTVNPSGDNTVEANEAVALSLAASSAYALGTPASVIGTITNDDGRILGTAASDTLTFTRAVDAITALEGADTFLLTNLNRSLLGRSANPSFDRITDLEAGLDVIDAPLNFTPATAINPTVLTTPVNNLRANGSGNIRELLNT